MKNNHPFPSISNSNIRLLSSYRILISRNLGDRSLISCSSVQGFSSSSFSQSTSCRNAEPNNPMDDGTGLLPAISILSKRMDRPEEEQAKAGEVLFAIISSAISAHDKKLSEILEAVKLRVERSEVNMPEAGSSAKAAAAPFVQVVNLESGQHPQGGGPAQGSGGLTTRLSKAMENVKASAATAQPLQTYPSRRPNILLATCGSPAGIKFGTLCLGFSEWSNVKAVGTPTALCFIPSASIPNSVEFYTQEHEWNSWKRLGDRILHSSLSEWADILVIAPLSANTLAKIAGGLCDNLLTCIIRSWDYAKPIFVAPCMSHSMWKHPLTEKQIMAIDDMGVNLIPPVEGRLLDGTFGIGAMVEPSDIVYTIRSYWAKWGPPGVAAK